jgi:hypothetical protein
MSHTNEKDESESPQNLRSKFGVLFRFYQQNLTNFGVFKFGTPNIEPYFYPDTKVAY